MNTNFKVIGLTQFGIKPKSTAPEADALTTRPSEQLLLNVIFLRLVVRVRNFMRIYRKQLMEITFTEFKP